MYDRRFTSSTFQVAKTCRETKKARTNKLRLIYTFYTEYILSVLRIKSKGFEQVVVTEFLFAIPVRHAYQYFILRINEGFHDDICTTPTTPIPTPSQSITMVCFTPLDLHTHIKLYGNLFLIQYILDNIIRSRWYLIEV